MFKIKIVVKCQKSLNCCLPSVGAPFLWLIFLSDKKI